MAEQDAQRGQAVQQRMRGGPSSSRAAAADQSGDSPEARRSRKKAGLGGAEKALLGLPLSLAHPQKRFSRWELLFSSVDKGAEAQRCLIIYGKSHDN